MDFDHNDILRILAIVHESHFSDLRLSVGDFRLNVQAPGDAARKATATPPKRNSEVDTQPAVAALTSHTVLSDRTKEHAAVPNEAVALCAPVLGVLCRAGEPDARPLVEIGDSVNAGDTVCFIRVLKELRPIKAGIAGTVTNIPAENGTLVEHEQTLIWVRPERPR